MQKAVFALHVPPPTEQQIAEWRRYYKSKRWKWMGGFGAFVFGGVLLLLGDAGPLKFFVGIGVWLWAVWCFDVLVLPHLFPRELSTVWVSGADSYSDISDAAGLLEDIEQEKCEEIVGWCGSFEPVKQYVSAVNNEGRKLVVGEYYLIKGASKDLLHADAIMAVRGIE